MDNNINKNIQNENNAKTEVKDLQTIISDINTFEQRRKEYNVLFNNKDYNNSKREYEKVNFNFNCSLFKVN